MNNEVFGRVAENSSDRLYSMMLKAACAFALPDNKKGGREMMEMNKKLALCLALILIMAMALGIIIEGLRILANPSSYSSYRVVDPRHGSDPKYGSDASIRCALGNSSGGGLIQVRNGTYHERVNVNKSVTIQWDYWTDDNRPERATIDGSGIGTVFRVNASDVQILNLTIQNAQIGISLLHNATNATIIDNLVRSNIEYGIYVDSARNTIKNNTLTSNSNFGLYIQSIGNTLRNNNMTGNTYNFGISNFVNNDIDTTNTLNGKPIYVWVDQHYRQVPPDAGYVAAVNSTYITIKDLNLSRNDYGIQFINSTYITAMNLTLSHNGVGVKFTNSSNSSITNVEASYNSGNGIRLDKAKDIKIEKVNVSSNGNQGIYSVLSYDNSINEASIAHNDGDGVYLWFSNSSRITNCSMSNNDFGAGIDLWESSDNIIAQNTIQNNYVCISCLRSSHNRFYHNNIKPKNNDPTKEVWLLEDSHEYWDNDAEGNWWSLFTYEDKNGDGIWDQSKTLDSFNTDHYPLVKPWKSIRSYKVGKTARDSRPPQFKGYDMTVCSNHVIDMSLSNFTKMPGENYPRILNLNVTAASSGFVNVAIPRAWLDGPFMLWINGIQQSSYQLTQNSSCSSLYFAYAAGGQYMVKIVGIKSGTIPTDINGDGKVDINDLARVSGSFAEYLSPNMASEVTVDP